MWSNYTIWFKLGTKDSEETITKDIVLNTTIDNNWKYLVHIDTNNFFDTLNISTYDSYKDFKAYWFLWFILEYTSSEYGCYTSKNSRINSITKFNTKYYFLETNNWYRRTIWDKLTNHSECYKIK